MKVTAVEEDSRPSSRQVHCPRTIVSPILRIPCEITSEIFQHCLSENEISRPSVKSAPLQISRVCSTWRKLAIRTPRLWSTIFLAHDFGESKGSLIDSMESHVKAFEIWVRRAKPVRMSIHLRYPTLPWLPGSETRPDVLPPVFRVIVANAATWSEVRLSLPGNYLSFAWTIIQQTASNLENFTIDDTSIPVHLESETAGTYAMFTGRAPLVYAAPEAEVAPFRRLRSLSLKHSEPHGCLDLLKSCPVLEDLRLHFYDVPSVYVFGDGVDIQLPRLHTFHLSHTRNSANEHSDIITTGGEIGLVLECLIVPNLKCFYLRMNIACYGYPELEWDYLARLITRSDCSLEELELRMPLLDTRSILKCLQLSPDLNFLGIPSDEALESEVKHILPSLQSLRIFK